MTADAARAIRDLQDRVAVLEWQMMHPVYYYTPPWNPNNMEPYKVTCTVVPPKED